MRAACLQMNSSNQIEENLQFVAQHLDEAKATGVDLLLLPENFAHMPAKSSELHVEDSSGGEVQDFLAAQSRQYQITLVAGSVAVRSRQDQNPSARCLVYEDGHQVSSYDKIHLFDVDLPGRESYRESASYAAGDPLAANLVVAQTSKAKLGLSICYDLRFPEMYRYLTSQGAEILLVPSAFTYRTGKAHWRSLLRARAIENQVFVMAAAQTGVHASGRQTWGHSIIIDPWGKVVAEMTDTQDSAETGLLFADLDLTKIAEVRQSLPAQSHRRLEGLGKQTGCTDFQKYT